MRYCTHCVTPETRPNIAFDAEGDCNACRQHEQRVAIDRDERARASQVEGSGLAALGFAPSFEHGVREYARWTVGVLRSAPVTP